MLNRIIGSARRPSWGPRALNPASPLTQMAAGGGMRGMLRRNQLELDGMGGGFSGLRPPAMIGPDTGASGIISDGVHRMPVGAPALNIRDFLKVLPDIGNQRSPARTMLMGNSPLTGTPQGVMQGTDNMRPVPPRPQGVQGSTTPFHGGMAGLPGIQGSGSPLADAKLNALTGLRMRIAEAAAGRGVNARAAAGQDEANYQRELDAARSREQVVEPEGDRSRTGMFNRMAEGQVMTPDRGLGSIEALRWGESPLVFNRQMTDEEAMDKVEREGKGFTRKSDALGGVRAYTSRRQAAEDRLAFLKESGASGAEIDEAHNEVRRLQQKDADAMGRYRANQQKFREKNNIPDGMSERDFRKMERRMQAGRKWMRENRINPNSPLAKTLYPELTGGGAAGGRSDTPPSPLTAPTGTPRAAEQARSFASEQAPNFPVAKALGATPEWGSFDLIKNLHEKDMQLELSDVSHLQQMMAAYLERSKADGTFDPEDRYGLRGFASNFNEENAQLLEGMFDGLLSLKDDNSRQKWASEWSSRKNKWHTSGLNEGYRPPSMGSPGSGR